MARSHNLCQVAAQAPFIELVVPILQERGLFRTEHSGSTLRDHLGLAKPALLQSTFEGRP
ncbi:hypothetical protein ELI49_34300 [Rhizobium ruizarguesonis]|uniref:Uncharacterized protein n=1 Tax=Rhizobium ruizarguesonis TaxID=2081791 RepID=A0AAE4YUX7_9HYPH|nr:hypothetical protein [Rhizobium ruizarguesonis]NEJ24903.1 hypothetical protein [Rhizobium leguminosarum]TBY51766.1 hypothetical protein E0H59_24545 [Rhizobium leguminosarum bv. viciae]NEI51139.1 hypothetical protein [Rhizobium ruizarguesonis]NEJ96038.1 hypothetical protein [Rhizobium ruizarguesonis]